MKTHNTWCGATLTSIHKEKDCGRPSHYRSRRFQTGAASPTSWTSRHNFYTREWIRIIGGRLFKEPSLWDRNQMESRTCTDKEVETLPYVRNPRRGDLEVSSLLWSGSWLDYGKKVAYEEKLEVVKELLTNSFMVAFDGNCPRNKVKR